jgi:hypothetical protein
MNQLRPWLPLIAPLLLLELGMIVIALRDLWRRERVRGHKWMWAMIILFVSLFGPILYLLLGRED